MELNDISLFGEETEKQVFDLLKEVEDLENGFGIIPETLKKEENRLTNEIFRIRESVLVSAVNKINAFLEENEKDFSCQIWQELKSLYLYGAGYHKQNTAEKDALNRAYKLFRYQLAKKGRLVENLDLCRNAYF